MKPNKRKNSGRMSQFINHRIKIEFEDQRRFHGQFLAYDKHMNIVLSECEEFRRLKKKRKKGDGAELEVREVKRVLGFVVLRGENITFVSVEAPPPAADTRLKLALPPNAGIGRAAGRGAPPRGAAGMPPGMPPAGGGSGLGRQQAPPSFGGRGSSTH